MYRILIVEDDDKIASILSVMIAKYDYVPIRATRFRELKSDFLAAAPDLVLLDINLPYYDGFYWCRQFRTVSNVPILFLSARAGEMDQVMAIENGGDDYITKPFHIDVVLAKIKSALRRAYGEYASSAPRRDELAVAGLRLDPAKNTLEFADCRAELSKNERLLLQSLMEQPDRILSREQLLEALWDDADFVDDNTLTVNVARVRKKLEDIGIEKAIETIRGQGYRLRVTWEENQS
jgi:DNA-binding response OmpR family regulator